VARGCRLTILGEESPPRLQREHGVAGQLAEHAVAFAARETLDLLVDPLGREGFTDPYLETARARNHRALGQRAMRPTHEHRQDGRPMTDGEVADTATEWLDFTGRRAGPFWENDQLSALLQRFARTCERLFQ